MRDGNGARFQRPEWIFDGIYCICGVIELKVYGLFGIVI